MGYYRVWVLAELIPGPFFGSYNTVLCFKWLYTTITRWNRMLLKLASCLTIPAGILDDWSLQEWPWVFVHRDHRDLPHTIPPIDFSSFLPVGIHKIISFRFLTVSLRLLSLPLRTGSGFLPVECVEKCEKWFDHHIFGHPSSLSSLLLNWIAPYLTENLHL